MTIFPLPPPPPGPLPDNTNQSIGQPTVSPTTYRISRDLWQFFPPVLNVALKGQRMAETQGQKNLAKVATLLRVSSRTVSGSEKKPFC